MSKFYKKIQIYDSYNVDSIIYRINTNNKLIIDTNIITNNNIINLNDKLVFDNVIDNYIELSAINTLSFYIKSDLIFTLSPTNIITTKRILLSDGIVTSPSLSLVNLTNIGFFRVSNDIRFSHTGNEKIRISNDVINNYNSIFVSGNNVSNLNVAFNDEGNTGFYATTGVIVGLVTNGVERMRFSSTITNLYVPVNISDGSITDPGASLYETTKGIYRIGDNNLGFIYGSIVVINSNINSVNIHPNFIKPLFYNYVYNDNTQSLNADIVTKIITNTTILTENSNGMNFSTNGTFQNISTITKFFIFKISVYFSSAVGINTIFLSGADDNIAQSEVVSGNKSSINLIGMRIIPVNGIVNFNMISTINNSVGSTSLGITTTKIYIYEI